MVRSPAWTTAVLLVLFTATQGIRDQASLSGFVGGFHVYAWDVFCCVLLLVAGFRSIVASSRNALLAVTWVMVLLWLIHVARGVSDFGLQTAIVGGRPWLYFLAPMAFAATVPTGWDKRIWKLFAVAGLAVAGISIPYLLVDGIQPASHLILRNGQLISSRPITAQGALLVLEAAIILLALRWPSPRGSVAFAAFAFADIVATQQRTVWAATLAVAIVGFFGWSRRHTLQNQRIVFATTGMLLIAIPIGVFAFLSTSTFRTSLEETTAQKSTFTWRTQSWQDLVSTHHSPLDLITGGPAGADWARVINQHVATQAPHDAFVEAFLRFGVPGVGLFCFVLVLLWSRRRDVGMVGALPASAVGLILVAQAIFSVSYMLGPNQGLILGAFISSLSWERSVSYSSARELGPDSPTTRLALGHS